jgi:hypothetical protein
MSGCAVDFIVLFFFFFFFFFFTAPSCGCCAEDSGAITGVGSGACSKACSG